MRALYLAFLGLVLVLVAVWISREPVEGYYATDSVSASDGPLAIKDGMLFYVYDSRKQYTKNDNWVARVIKENTRASDVSGMDLFKINDSSAIGLLEVDLNRPENEILRPIFPNNMGLYVKGTKSSLLLNSYFGMDRINNEADAKKIINALFVAKGEEELATAMSKQLGLYVERRNDMPTVDALMESVLKKLALRAST